MIERSGQPSLTNRRLFAFADNSIPDGIKCDMRGNVYSGCGDGVHVWSALGVFLGKSVIPGGVANFCFGRDGELFLLNEHRLWRAKLNQGVKGALLCLAQPKLNLLNKQCVVKFCLEQPRKNPRFRSC